MKIHCGNTAVTIRLNHEDAIRLCQEYLHTTRKADPAVHATGALLTNSAPDVDDSEAQWRPGAVYFVFEKE